MILLRGPKESKHAHPPNQEEAGAVTVKANLKKVATEHPQVPPAQILRTHLSHVPSEILVELPEGENLKKAIRRVRRKDLPPNPKSLQDLEEIPERFQKTTGEAPEQFLLFDSKYDGEEDEGRVILFGTKQNLEILARSQIWFLNGTFKVSHHLYSSFYYYGQN